jgi:hypothetical protein
VNIDIDLPISLAAVFDSWNPDISGTAVVIMFGTAQVAVIPTPQFDSGPRRPYKWASDSEISEIAAEWLRARLGIAA